MGKIRLEDWPFSEGKTATVLGKKWSKDFLGCRQ